MRFGCCLNMVSSEADKGTGIDFIETLSEIGYDYVELPLAEMAALSEEEFLSLKRRIDRTGIKCEVCNNFFPKTGVSRLYGNYGVCGQGFETCTESRRRICGIRKRTR